MSKDDLDALLERKKKSFFKEVKFYAAIVIAILVFTMIQHLMQ